MRRAVELYEADPKDGLHPQPILFSLDDEQRILVQPLVVTIEPPAFEAFSRMGGKALEQAAFMRVAEEAQKVPITRLLGVGYLFAASGDFPQTDQDAALAGWLRAQKADTPWSSEGVVLILDAPGERRSYAALRPQGEVADPLSEPRRMVVFAEHVPRLYPYGDGPVRAADCD